MSSAAAKILLVDDEPALTKLMKTYLEKLGYTVDTCLRAAEGLSLFEKNSSDYDILVADITLPDMPGNEMALQMLGIRPDLKVLLCSGYPFAVDSLPEAAQPHFDTLQKPFLPNMLAKSLEDLLQRSIK